MKIHAHFDRPNYLDPAKDVLELRFDSPRQAKGVTVQLIEVDRGVRKEGGTDDIIAIFEGEIAGGQFKGRLVRKATPPEGAPVFNFRFQGDAQMHTLQIPSGRGEKEKGDQERGAYEIGVKVTTHKPRMVYDSRVLARIRNLPQADRVADQRPVITFRVAAKDKSGFYVAAGRFWEPASDRMIIVPSLQQVIAFLNRPKGKTKDKMKFGPWGEINLVSHGAEDGWTEMRLFAKGRRGSTTQAMIDSKNDRRLRLTTAEIDKQTTVVWRGCLLAKKNLDFLSATRTIFGGECTVYGPKFLQSYHTERVGSVWHAWEYFAENFYVDIPWRPPHKKRPKLPSEAEIVEKLKAKYPPGTATDDEWARLVADKNSRHDTSVRRGPMRMDYTVTLGRKLTKQDKKEYKDIATQALQSPDAGKQGLVYEEYHWRINSPVFSKKNRAYVVLCRGTKYRIEVRRKVRDAQGRVIVPNLRDPTHYGRVP